MPVKNLSGGVLAWLSLSLASVKSRLVPAHLGSPGNRAIKRVCVCLNFTVRPTYDGDLQSAITITRQLVVDCKTCKSFTVSLSYDNRKMFCKLDVRHKKIVTLALS